MKHTLETLREGISIPHAEAMEALGWEFVNYLHDDAVLTLSGALGVGKTTFVRGLAAALEIRETVSSPTFNLYNIYQGKRQLIHMDAYRLASGDDLEAVMLEDFMQSPWLWVVEWPEKIQEALPDDCISLGLWIEEGLHHVKLATGL